MQYYCLIVLGINQKQTNILQEHSGIYESIVLNQPDAARQRMLSHIQRDLDVIQSQAGVLPALR